MHLLSLRSLSHKSWTRGQSLIEYLIIVALIAIGSISIMRSLGETVYVRFANITGALQHRSVDFQPTQVTGDEFKKRGLDDFSKVPAMGQAFLETLISLVALVLVSLVGVLIILQGIGTLLISKWAAQNSLCVALQKNPGMCAQTTREELAKYFTFKKIIVSTKVVRGVIHSDVQGWIAGRRCYQREL